MDKGLKSVPTLSAKEIAKKHGVSLEYIIKQIAKGVKVEREHTKSTKEANEIARDHLGERPDYYTKLNKMEKSKVSLNELGEGDSKGGAPVVGDLTGSSRKVTKVDEDIANIKKKLSKAAKVGSVVGALGAHAGKVYDVGNVVSHHDDPGLATATAVSYLHPASRMLQAAPTVIKVDKAGKGENEFKRQKLYGGKNLKLKEDLRKWFREKWVRYDTKGNIKGPCAREEGEGKPKCRPLASARSMSKDERAKSARRKRREDPVADRPGKGEKPVMVRTEETLLEKNIPTNPELWARAKAAAKAKFDVYPSAYANGWASKWYKSKGGGWKSAANESVDEACWSGYKMEGMKKKGSKRVPNCVPVQETGQVMSRYTERPTYEANNKYPDTSERGIYEGRPSTKQKPEIVSHDGKDIGKLWNHGDGSFSSIRKKGALNVSKKHKSREVAIQHLKDKASEMKEGYASIGHSYDWAGDVNSKAKFYGNKPKATTTKGDEKDDTYKDSNKGKKVKFAKTVKEAQIDEISAELVGKVSNERWRRGQTPSKTLTRAIAKKFIESGKKKEEEPPFEGGRKRSHEKSSTHVRRLAMKGLKSQLKEELMDNKDQIQEAIGNIMEENLHEMKENLLAVLQEKAMHKLEERKKEIAANYFGQ